MEREAMILQQEKKLLGGKTAEATSQIQGMQDAVTTAEKSKQMGALDSTMELWIQQLENEVQFVRSSLDTEAQVDLEDALNQAVAAQQELENHAKYEREETLAENTAELNEPRQQVAAAAAEASQVDLEDQVEKLDAQLQEPKTRPFKAREQSGIGHSASDATQSTLQQVQVDLQRERAERKGRKEERHQSARGSQRSTMDAVQATIAKMEAQKNAEISRLERELHMGHTRLSEQQKPMVQLRTQLSGAVSGHKKRLAAGSLADVLMRWHKAVMSKALLTWLGATRALAMPEVMAKQQDDALSKARRTHEAEKNRELHALGDEKEAAAAAALAAEKEAAAAAQAKADTEAAVEACRDATTQQLITQLDAKREMALTRAYRDAEEEQGTALTTPQIQHDAADHPRQGGRTVQHELQPRMKNPRAHHHIVTSQTRDAQSDASSRSAGAMSQRHAAQSQAQPPTTSTEERNRAAVSSSVGYTQGHSDRLTLAARHIQFELSSLDVASVGSTGHHRASTTTNAGAQHHLAAVDVQSQAGRLGEADTDGQQRQPPWPPPMHPAHVPIPQWQAPLTQVPMTTPWYNSPAPWYPPPWVPPPWQGIPSTPWGFPPWVPWHVSPMMPGRNSPTQRAPQAQYHATAALPRSAQPQTTSQHRAGETRSPTGAVTDETEGHRAEMRDTTQNAAGGQCQVTAPARTPPSGGAPAPWRHADGITKADTNSDAAELIHAAGMRTQRSPKAQTPPHEGHSRTAAAVARHRAATDGGQPCTERPHRTAAVVKSSYKANFIGGQPKSTGTSAQIVLLPAEVQHHPTADKTQRHRESISPTQPSGGAQVLVPSSGRDGRVYPNITEVQPQRMPQDAELPNPETTGMHTAQQCNYASRDGPRGCPGPPGNARNQTALHVGCHNSHGCPGPPLQHVRHVYIASTSTVLQATCGTGASR
jgi:hypothetical protein